MRNKKKSSKNVASLASKILRDNNSSTISKKLAGSVLSQSSSQKQTGAEMEEVASDVLKSDKYSDKTKTLAGITPFAVKQTEIIYSFF